MKKKRKKINFHLWEENISALIFLAMLILLTLVFVSRIFSGFSFAFAEEIVVQLFLCLTMFSLSSCLVSGLLMGMSLITDKLKGVVKKASYIFIFVVCDFMFLFLGWQGMEMVMSQFKYDLRTPILQMPYWIFTLCIPIGCLMFLIRSVQLLINQLNGYQDLTDDELMALEAQEAMESQENREAIEKLLQDTAAAGGDAKGGDEE